jgi:hypothetical protein
MKLNFEKKFCKLYVLKNVYSTLGLRPTVNIALIPLYVCQDQVSHTK